MLTREVCANPGTMWALRASVGSQGMARSHVWVDLICSPSGRLIVSGLVAGRTFSTGVPGRTKCPVAPASAIALSIAILIFEVFMARSWFSAVILFFNFNRFMVCLHVCVLVTGVPYRCGYKKRGLIDGPVDSIFGGRSVEFSRDVTCVVCLS